MVTDCTNGHLDKVKAFASLAGKADQLEGQLQYLDQYACNSGRQTRCLLFRDFAPQSFAFNMEIKREDEPDTAYKFWFNGGLIFHGVHDGGGNGSAPTFSVCLEPQDGWSVHT